jgi:DNA polymerase III subunit alpha
VNKKVIECLIKAGAFDALAPAGSDVRLSWRARLVAGVDRVLDHGNRHQKDRDQGQSRLFGGDDTASERMEDDAALPVARPWTETEALTFEKEALGLYMSGHPLQRYAAAIAGAGARTPQALTQSEPEVAVAGVVTGLRPLKTKRGDRMCVFMLEDELAKVEALVFPEAFSKCGALAQDDAMLLVRGKYERDEDTSRLVVSEMTLLDVIRDRAVREVEIRLSGVGLARHTMHALAGVLDRHAGDRRVLFVVELNGGSRLRVRTATARRIKPSDGFVKDVEAVCGTGSVVMR